MKYAKHFSIFILTAVLGYATVAFYFLPLATFQGELTRMALLPETLFGWTKPQPALDIAWMQQASIAEADVFIVGDSFSDSRVWQTVLTRNGMKVRTESWESIRNVCEDFMPWLKAQGFNGKYVLIQSIERSVAFRLHSSVACQHMQYHPNILTDQPRSPPAVSFNVNFGNYSGKLSTGIRTQLDVLEYEHLSRAPGFSTWQLPNDVNMARVPNGCELFSHASCNDSLFLSFEKPEDVGEGVLNDITKLNARLSGVTPIWVIVPNKTTAYLYPNKQFWNNSEHRFHAPNLLRMTQQAVQNKIVDLYPANNTHLSTEGYLLMGEEIFKTMQQAKPQARQH